MSHVVSVKAFDGRTVTLGGEDWLHIALRHPEVGPDSELVSRTLSHPDEAYSNSRGGVHVLRRIDESHFLVVIYHPTNGEGFVRTAYLTNEKRKNRRYRGSQSLKLF